MSVRRPTTSRFRPQILPDRSVLTEHRAVIQDISRRRLLRGVLSLGGLSMLTGCNVSDRSSVQDVLRSVSSFNDRVQGWLFDPGKLAPTYAASQVVKPPRFNAYYDVEDVNPIDITSWKLELAGLIKDKRPWSLQDIYALPEQEEIIKHICVEGWDYIGQWSGPNLRAFLERVGADLTAKYIYFICNDDFTESIDMATALHPQTILATKYAGDRLADPFGYPLRLRTSTKLGYKNAKWIKAIEVTNDYRETFWSKQGFNWFAGI